jgi:hypothetical protein
MDRVADQVRRALLAFRGPLGIGVVWHAVHLKIRGEVPMELSRIRSFAHEAETWMSLIVNS